VLFQVSPEHQQDTAAAEVVAHIAAELVALAERAAAEMQTQVAFPQILEAQTRVAVEEVREV